MNEHAKIQTNVKEIEKIQHDFGGYSPDLINMYFAKRLHTLTTALVWLTAVLAALTIALIFFTIRITQ